jgi:histidinol dehydrogenase
MIGFRMGMIKQRPTPIDEWKSPSQLFLTRWRAGTQPATLAPMRIIRHSDADFAVQLAAVTAPSSLFDPVIEQRTRAIVDAVRERGDAAMLEYTERFDGAKLRAEQLAVTHAEFMHASLSADDSLREAVALAHKNIMAYSKRCLRRNWTSRNAQGAKVGEKFDPFQRVGVYIPGGMAPLVSTALMTVTLAKAAGCPEIVVCTPCGKEGTVNPALLHAARVAGATEVYRVGGAQAIAALAHGTKTIRRTQKIFGPGNAYVVAAKRLLVGYVAIDLLPGPSELLVLADETANAAFAAADLIAQAEHGSGYERVWLVTPSAKVVDAVEKQLAKQLPKAKRRSLIEPVLGKNSWAIQTKSMDDAIALTNQLAPEHLEIMTRNAARVSERITTAGAIFLGPWTPTVLGDYVAGPSHTLPTGGAGLSFPGLTADMFQRRTSLVEYSKPALRRSLKAVRKFAEMEGLEGHGKSAEVRF